MRSVSDAFRQALYAQESDEVAVCLITVTHPELTDPIRLSTDPTTRLSTDPLLYGTKSRGDDYSFVPINVMIPEEGEEAPAATLEIDNTDLGLITAIRSVTQAASVKIEIVLASDPDTVEIEYPAMTVSHVDYDAQTIRFSLAIDSLATEPFPGTAFIPSMFPSLF